MNAPRSGCPINLTPVRGGLIEAGLREQGCKEWDTSYSSHVCVSPTVPFTPETTSHPQSIRCNRALPNATDMLGAVRLNGYANRGSAPPLTWRPYLEVETLLFHSSLRKINELQESLVRVMWTVDQLAAEAEEKYGGEAGWTG